MSAAPAITVLMTVFNGEKHLPAAVESILRQSFRDFEFLVVDDASTDRSLDVLKSFAVRDSRLRILENTTNKGQTACLNQGLREARGEWIARQDADDLSLPKRLESHWNAIHANPDLVLTGVNGWIIDESSRCTGMIHVPLNDSGIRWSMPWRNPFIHTGVMFRAGEGVYDEKFRICQDWELWNRLAERGQMLNLSKRLVVYRDSPNSLSHVSAERTEAECGEIISRIWRSLYGGEPEEAELMQKFRNGLSVSELQIFWKFYQRTRLRWSGGEMRLASAVHHWQVAGGLPSNEIWEICREVLNAFADAPSWTLNAIACRIFSRPDFSIPKESD